MPARTFAHLRRAAVTATMLVALALAGALVAVSPAQASVEPWDPGSSAANLLAAPPPARLPAPVPVLTPASKVLALAAALRGRPYQYGASGPSSFDCSGYTRYVFAHAVGRSLAHNAASQYAYSLKIANSAIRPGDLVFYVSGGWAYHVGIYAGGGLFWDAPYTGASVRLERIATSSWVAGRVL
jgi:cell wall-associated NlpC family hydrolase